MQTILETEGFAIFDDVFPESILASMWEYLQDEPCRFVQSGRWKKIFRLGDGNSLETGAIISKPMETDKISRVYPTGLAPDALYELISTQRASWIPWLGQPSDSDLTSIRGTIYPRGTGLSWHDDHTGVKGAFILYVHPHWNAEWGGELLIEDSPNKNNRSDYSRVHLNNDNQNQELLMKGHGRFIFPKPNRLVLIASGTKHSIKKVDPEAGSHVRAALSGFIHEAGTR
jgi:hypothetical protein